MEIFAVFSLCLTIAASVGGCAWFLSRKLGKLSAQIEDVRCEIAGVWGEIETVEITDAAALPSFLVKTEIKPDKHKIKQLLQQGLAVPGARLVKSTSRTIVAARAEKAEIAAAEQKLLGLK